MSQKIIPIGKILSRHGFKNKVKCSIEISEKNFADLVISGKAFFKDGEQLKVLNVSFYRDTALLSMDVDYSNIDNLIGCLIYSNRDSFSKNEMLVMDLKGMDVFERSFFKKEHYGKVVDIKNFGGGDLIEIIPNTVVSDDDTEFFLFNKHFFPELSLKKGYIILKKRKTKLVEFDSNS